MGKELNGLDVISNLLGIVSIQILVNILLDKTENKKVYLILSVGAVILGMYLAGNKSYIIYSMLAMTFIPVIIMNIMLHKNSIIDKIKYAGLFQFLIFIVVGLLLKYLDGVDLIIEYNNIVAESFNMEFFASIDEGIEKYELIDRIRNVAIIYIPAILLIYSYIIAMLSVIIESMIRKHKVYVEVLKFNVSKKYIYAFFIGSLLIRMFSNNESVAYELLLNAQLIVSSLIYVQGVITAVYYIFKNTKSKLIAGFILALSMILQEIFLLLGFVDIAFGIRKKIK
jgi:hypothetical protein